MSNAATTSVTLQPSPIRRHGSNQDADADGAIDPTLDNSLIAIPEDGAAGDDEESADLEIGQFIPPVRNLGADSGEADPELDTGTCLAEPAEAPPEDDLDGPVAETEFMATLPETTICDEEPDDEAGLIDESFESGKFPTLDLESELLRRHDGRNLRRGSYRRQRSGRGLVCSALV